MTDLSKYRSAGLAICISFSTVGCSSMMSHTGPNQGYYPGTKVNAEMVADSSNGWAVRSMAAIDAPFSALLDTVLLPWDYLRRNSDKGDDSLRERVLRSEKLAHTNENLASAAPLPVTPHSPQ